MSYSQFSFDDDDSDLTIFNSALNFDIYEAYVWNFKYNFTGQISESQIIVVNNEDQTKVSLLVNFVNFTNQEGLATGYSVNYGFQAICSKFTDIDQISPGTLIVYDISDNLICNPDNVVANCKDAINVSNSAILNYFFTTDSDQEGTLGHVKLVQTCPVGEELVAISSSSSLNPASEEIECLYEPDFYTYSWSTPKFTCQQIDVDPSTPIIPPIANFVACSQPFIFDCEFGTCFTNGVDIECRCDAGFDYDDTEAPQPKPCSANKNECDSSLTNLCAQPNSCSDLDPTLSTSDGYFYTCICPPEYQHDPNFISNQILGGICDVRINDCSNNPCTTDGDLQSLCTDGVRQISGQEAYDCTCSDGYFFSEQTCILSDPCLANNPCGVNGNCINSEGRAVCSCFTGWEGNTCDNPIIFVPSPISPSSITVIDPEDNNLINFITPTEPVQNICTCVNGSPATPSFCPSNGIEYCVACLENWILNENTNSCEANPCRSNQVPSFLNSEDSDICSSNIFSSHTFTGTILIQIIWHEDYLDSSSVRFLNLQTTLEREFKLALPYIMEFTLFYVVRANGLRSKRQAESTAEETVTTAYAIQVANYDKDATEIDVQVTIERQLEKYASISSDSFVLFSESNLSQLAITTNIDELTLCADIEILDDSDSSLNIYEGKSNSCDNSEQDIINTGNNLLSIKSQLESGFQDLSPEDKLKLAIQASNEIENLQRSNNNLDVLVTLEENISESQIAFEEILINSEPNMKFTSRDQLVAVETTNRTSDINPITNVLEKNYNYKSTLSNSGLTIVLPAENIDSNLLNDPVKCPTPVVFSELSVSKHLKADDEEVSEISSTSVLITTCDEQANLNFKKPVTIQFKQTGPSDATNNSKLDLSETMCVYYDTDINKWLPQMKAIYDPETGTFTCESRHLTYFSLLFQDSIKDNKALTRFDIFSNIFSLICCFSVIIFILFLTEGGIKTLSRKLGEKPLFRSYLQLAISLSIINLTFLFGQQFYSPEAGEEKDCVAVAHILHWSILSFFFITLETSLVMLAAIFMKSWFMMKKWYSKFVILVWPHLLSAIIVLICMRIAKNRGDGYYYGGLESKKSYLRMKTLLNTGDTLCFVQGDYFDFGLILPYGLAMGAVLLSYLFSAKSIIYDHAESDLGANIDKAKNNAKKLILLFFTIGMCWLFLIFSMVKETQSLGVDWTFTILKTLQAFVLFFICCFAKIRRFVTGKMTRRSDSYSVNTNINDDM